MKCGLDDCGLPQASLRSHTTKGVGGQEVTVGTGLRLHHACHTRAVLLSPYQHYQFKRQTQRVRARERVNLQSHTPYTHKSQGWAEVMAKVRNEECNPSLSWECKNPTIQVITRCPPRSALAWSSSQETEPKWNPFTLMWNSSIFTKPNTRSKSVHFYLLYTLRLQKRFGLTVSICCQKTLKSIAMHASLCTCERAI